MHRHIGDLASRHLDVADVPAEHQPRLEVSILNLGLLVEERLEDNDLVAGLNESHESTQHTLVGASGDGDLRLRVQLPPPVRRVSVSNGLLQPRPALRRAVLVAVHTVEGLLGSIENEVWRVVAKEALAHVHNGLG